MVCKCVLRVVILLLEAVYETTATNARKTAVVNVRNEATSSELELGRRFMERYREVFKALAQEDLRDSDLES